MGLKATGFEILTIQGFFLQCSFINPSPFIGSDNCSTPHFSEAISNATRNPIYNKQNCQINWEEKMAWHSGGNWEKLFWKITDKFFQ
jgi:hypothetical protein